MLATGLLYIAFTMFRCGPWIPDLSKTFNMKGAEYCKMLFQNLMKWSYGFFFEFVYVVDFIDGFPYIEPSLHPWDEAYLVMMDDRFDVFLDSFGENFIEYLFLHRYS